MATSRKARARSKAKAKGKAKPRSSARRRARSAPPLAAAPVGAADVTQQSAEQVVGQIKLLCDGRTDVLFFREGGRLFMRPVERT